MVIVGGNTGHLAQQAGKFCFQCLWQPPPAGPGNRPIGQLQIIRMMLFLMMGQPGLFVLGLALAG